MKHLITTYTRAILLMALMFLMPSMMWADKEAYVQYADGTLTFRYDENRASYTDTYPLPASGDKPGWIAHSKDVTKAVINQDFKDARPERCAMWFSNMSKLTDIEGMQYLCTDSVNDMSNMFYHCEKLATIDLSHFNTEHVTTMTGMFRYCFALTQLDLSTFSTEKVDNMSYMFGFCDNLTSLDLKTFDTQTVNNMTGMFAGDSALAHIYVSHSFVLDQVTQSDKMFYYCLSLPGFDSNSIDKTKASEYLTYNIQPWAEYQDATKTLTFRYDDLKDYVTATAKYDLPASGDDPGWLKHKFDIKKVVFSETFKDARPERCTKWFSQMMYLTNIQGMEYLCTDSVNDMSLMFNQCKLLTSLDLSHFKTDCVTTMTRMFSGCSSLTALDVTSFNTGKVDDMSYMFYLCSKLTELDLSSFDTRKVTNMKSMFNSDDKLTHIYASDLFVTDQVTSSADMFTSCQNLPHFDPDYPDNTKAPEYLTFTSAQPWVEYQADTKTLTFHNDNTRSAATATGKYDLPAAGVAPGWITHSEGVTKAVINQDFKDVRPERCAKWFYGMSNLTEIQGLEYLCTDSVNDMSQMFYRCEKLTTIDLSHFNTERVTTMTGMFRNCFALTQLYLFTFRTEKVDDMSYMFSFCENLTSLDLTAFDTRTVNNMTGMFAGDAALTCIYVSGSFVLDQVTQSKNMFYYCLKLPSFNSDSIDKTKAPVYLTYLTIQPWAEYQADTKTLTFHYDHSQVAVTATAQYDMPAANDEPGWVEHSNDITTVVFKEEFKDARPKSCAKWFYRMVNLTDIQGIEYLCTDSVNDMSYMFCYCEKLATIDLSHFNTERVTTMTYMFSGCNLLTALDVTSFNTHNVNDMSYMFKNYKSLTELDLSTFDTRKVTNMIEMFSYDKALTHIYVSDLFAVNQVDQSDFMFWQSESLPGYDSRSIDKTRAHYKESEGGYLTLRRHFTVGDSQYNVDGYDSPTCYTDVTFTDGAAYTSSCDFTFSSDNTASYTRMVSNHWATLCLPFTFSADDNGTAKFYGVESYTEDNIAVTALTGEIAAGTPVLAYVTDGELSVTATGAAAVAEAKQFNELKGTFAQKEVANDDYIIANDHFWNAGWLKQNNADVKNVYVAPYRASLTLSSTSAKPNSISITEGETDGIDGIDGGVTDPSALLYDLQGRRLSAPQRGVMIVRKNGVSRKVIIGSQAPQGL